MSDVLLTELRRIVDPECKGYSLRTVREAIDEIERLRARVAELEGDLLDLFNDFDWHEIRREAGSIVAAWRKGRAISQSRAASMKLRGPDDAP